MSKGRADIGRTAEQTALDYLCSEGLILVCRNYRCRWGEIDLIMRQSEELVFVEVRYRKYQQYGGALASIAPAKQRKLALTALHYLSRVQKCLNTPCRFDVIGQQPEQNTTDSTAQLQWIRNAFEINL